MLYKKEIIEQVRKDFNIPDNYKSYIDDTWQFWEIVKKEKKPEVFYSEIEPNSVICHIDEEFGIIREDYYIIVKLFIKENAQNNTIVFVFTEDLDKLYKEFLYKKPIERKRFEYGPGFYRPVQSMFGYVLEPIVLADNNRPVLNDNLGVVLTNEIESFIKKEKIYSDMNIEYKRGVLLFGPPGNGKTMFIKHLLNNRKDTISILCEKNNIQEIGFLSTLLAEDYLKDTLKILVMEDIDGINVVVRSHLLNFLDGLMPMHKTMIIATTNFPDKLDIAIKNRPSRFDSVHIIDKPNKASRKKLLKEFFPDISNGMLEEAATASDTFSGAYFKEIYVLSKLNDISCVEAINEIKKRMKVFN